MWATIDTYNCSFYCGTFYTLVPYNYKHIDNVN